MRHKILFGDKLFPKKGWATVHDDVSEETINALNKLAEAALKNRDNIQLSIHSAHINFDECLKCGGTGWYWGGDYGQQRKNCTKCKPTPSSD